MYINTFFITKMIYLTFLNAEKESFLRFQARQGFAFSGRASVSPAWPGECRDLNMTKCW